MMDLWTYKDKDNYYQVKRKRFSELEIREKQQSTS